MSMQAVAKYAGVSTATVSRVINSSANVRPATVRLVQAAIESLKYDAADIGRTSGGRSRSKKSAEVKLIAVVAVGSNRDRPRSVSHAVIDAITRSAKRSGIRVLLEEMPDISEISSIIQNREVQGAVAMLADDVSPDILNQMNRIVPIVWAMGGHMGPVEVDHVAENNTAIGYLAHRHLQRLGCRNLAFLSILPQKRHARQRGQAFLAAAAEHGQACRSYLLTENSLLSNLYGANVVSCGTIAGLVEELTSLKRSDRLPDGLFVDRDATTARLYPLLIRAGIEPGQDIKIVSCDNDELVLSGLSPRPATIDLGIDELASRIVRRLVLRIQNREEPPITLQTTPHLRVGETDSAEFDDQGLPGSEFSTPIGAEAVSTERVSTERVSKEAASQAAVAAPLMVS